MQVESFMLLLLQLTLPALASNTPLHAVEFGSGSGNLVLPLAHLFPSFTFTAVDMKASAVQLLRQRVQQGRMRNVRVQEGTIEAFQGGLGAQQAAHILAVLAGSAASRTHPCCVSRLFVRHHLLACGMQLVAETWQGLSSMLAVVTVTSVYNGQALLLLLLLLLLLSCVTGAADVVLALHACGAASDWSLAQAAARSAAFIVSPCCIGKVNKVNAAGLLYRQDGSARQQPAHSAAEQAKQALEVAGQIQYPRSHWLMQQMDVLAAKVKAEQMQQPQEVAASFPEAEAADAAGGRMQQQQPLNPLQQAVLQSNSRSQQCRALFSLMAQAADYSHQEDHSYPDLAALAKSNVELDRGLGMAEAGYSSALVRLLQPELTAKSDVLVGVPAVLASGVRSEAEPGGVAPGFGWTWA
jgi:hypothetical protein